MKSSAFLFLVAILSSTANAQNPDSRQDDTSIYGTNAVEFVPMQAGGVLEGCTLAYTAVVADTAYRRGEPVVVVGTFGVHIRDKAVTLILKLGVRDLPLQNSKFEAPHFAYLQGVTATIAKSRYVSNPSDEGFQLFVFRFDDEATTVIAEAIESRKITMGFNRRENGLDVLVPIDLTVVKIGGSGATVVRTRSDSQTKEFGQCLLKLIQDAESMLGR